MRIVTLPGVFRPHSDSWLLAEAVAGETLPSRPRVLDLCTGSGVVAVRAAQRGCAVVAVDRSRRAVWTAGLNGRLNGVRVDARRGDLFDAVGDARFDLIAANPPYVPADSDTLPQHGARRAWDAGRDGRAVLDRLCARAPGHLRPGGVVLLAHSSVCDEQQTLDQLQAGGLEAEVVRRRRGPLGPLLTQRAGMLEAQGLLAPGQREEDVVVVRGRAAPRSVSSRAYAGGRVASP